MGRKILAVIVALITGWAVFTIVELISTRMWSTPNNLEYMTREEVVAYFASRPPAAFGVLLFGYIVGSFTAGFIVTKMSRHESPGTTLPILIGVLFTLGAILNFFVLLPGQPIWFCLVSLFVYIPFSLIGHRFAR